MSLRRVKPFYNTPLNCSKTIDLPSNLLSHKPTLSQYSSQLNKTQNFSPKNSPRNSPNNSPRNSPRQFLQHLVDKKKSQGIVIVQQKNKSKANALYKRLSDIKIKNDELNKYSYSKLLSKMVIMNPKISQEGERPNRAYRTISDYNCLRGKLVSINYQKQQPLEHAIAQSNPKSRNSDYSNKTTRIFKRLYLASSQKSDQLSKGDMSEQKYIYTNGKKTECRRIHNFYTSQNFRNSYDRAFGKTMGEKGFGRTGNSFYSKESRY